MYTFNAMYSYSEITWVNKVNTKSNNIDLSKSQKEFKKKIINNLSLYLPTIGGAII